MGLFGRDTPLGNAEQELLDAIEAHDHARRLEEIYVDGDILDPGNCPPDRRFLRGDKEAWVYEHGNISELVFVRWPERE